MGIKTFRPITPTLRFAERPTFDEITKDHPEKSLTEIKKGTGGRNNRGRILDLGRRPARHRIIDFKRLKRASRRRSRRSSMIQTVPRASLLKYTDGEKPISWRPRAKVGSSRRRRVPPIRAVRCRGKIPGQRGPQHRDEPAAYQPRSAGKPPSWVSTRLLPAELPSKSESPCDLLCHHRKVGNVGIERHARESGGSGCRSLRPRMAERSITRTAAARPQQERWRQAASVALGPARSGPEDPQAQYRLTVHRAEAPKVTARR